MVSTTTRTETTERAAWRVSGFAALILTTVALLAGAGLIAAGAVRATVPAIIAGALLIVIGALSSGGYYVVQPNQATALTVFGRYIGTTTDAGFHWSNPFAIPRRTVSLRVRNFVSERMKVNDKAGNPIEIAAVVVWRVVDSAHALFDVDDFEAFVAIQSETAIRHLATLYPYDDHDGSDRSLRGNAEEVSATLKAELEERLAPAGVEVIETRLAHLAYAPEIAEAMLRRQQASAVVAARKEIVTGAVGMVESALQALSERGVVDLDEERKAAMVSNLMVVLTSDRAATPVVNTGTLYT